MTRIRTTMMTLATLGALGRVASACASTEQAAAAVEEAPEDAGADSALADAEVEAEIPNVTADAEVDASKGCTDQSWCHTTLPLVPDGDGGMIAPAKGMNLVDVWAAPNHEAWAVTAEGYVLHWSLDQWRFVFDSKATLQTIWGTPDGEIWITGKSHYVARGVDKAGGILFETVDVSAEEDILRVRGTSSTDVWAITAHKIFRHAGAHDNAGKPLFDSFDFANGVESPSKNTLKTMYQRNSDIWVAGTETTDCSTNAKTCCYTDNGCPTNYVTARWKGDVGDHSNGDPSTIGAWDRIVMQNDRLADLRTGTVSTNGVHSLMTRAFPGYGWWITRVARTDADAIDASAAMPAGDYWWTLDDLPPYGGTPEALWSSSSDDVWEVGSPGVVRRWDGTRWNIAHVSITAYPLLDALHGIDGVVTETEHELWVVGQDIALHRVVER